MIGLAKRIYGRGAQRSGKVQAVSVFAYTQPMSGITCLMVSLPEGKTTQ